MNDPDASKVDLVQSWVGTNLIADGDIDVTWQDGYVIAAAIPEPATLLLLAAGGLLLNRRVDK